MRAYESYAEALFYAAEALGEIQQIAEDATVMDELFATCGWFLNDPRVGKDDKAAFLTAALSDYLHPLAIEFLLLTLGRHHLRHVPAAIEWFRHLYDRYLGRATVRIRVPYELDAQLLEQLKSRLISDGLVPGGSLEKTEFQVVVDNSLIGGFIADSNGMQIDASLESALTKIKGAS